MGDKTGIEWTDATWNPLVGCSIASLGCAHCYAMNAAFRLGRMAEEAEALGKISPTAHYKGLAYKSKAGQFLWTGEVREAPESILLKPVTWQRPRKIFVNSMSDLFHESVPFETIDRIFAIMACCPQHRFQTLTKRADRMREYMTTPRRHGQILDAASKLPIRDGPKIASHTAPWPLPNVWLGVTAEDQANWDARVPHLLATPAAVRWVSYEPAIGPIVPALRDFGQGDNGSWPFTVEPHARIDWVVAGGESGPGARPFEDEWAENMLDHCRAAGVKFLMKQRGSAKHPKTYKDFASFPAALQVREYPHA